MRRGITLYEVVIAMALFAGSAAAVAEGIATGTRAALQSRLQSQAVLLCESKMSEILSGAVPPQSNADAAFTEPWLDGWKWTLSARQGPRTGLMLVDVTVACNRASNSVDASFTLTRLVRDPQAFVTSASAASSATNQQQTSQ